MDTQLSTNASIIFPPRMQLLWPTLCPMSMPSVFGLSLSPPFHTIGSAIKKSFYNVLQNLEKKFNTEALSFVDK